MKIASEQAPAAKIASEQAPAARRTVEASDDGLSIRGATKRYPVASVTLYAWKRQGRIASRTSPGRVSLYSARELEAALAASSRGRIGGRACLVTMAFAAEHSGVSERLIRYWITTGRVKVRGRWRRGTWPLRDVDLVSLREIEDELARDRDFCSLAEAKRQLGTGRSTVLKLCDAGVLPFEKRRQTYEIERAPLDRLAAELRQCVTLAEAARHSGLPGWLLERLIDEERLSEPFAGLIGRRLVRLADVDELAAEFKRDRQRCESGCGELALPGRRFCASHAWSAPQVAAWWERPGAREAISARLSAFWASPAGQEAKEALARARRKRVAIKCDVCGSGLERRPCEVQTEHRNVCSICRPHWRNALLVASGWATAQASTTGTVNPEAFARVLELGDELEASVNKKQGRPRRLKMNLAIEVFYGRGFSDGQITKLINHALARGDLELTSVSGSVKTNYVRDRRKRAKIKR